MSTLTLRPGPLFYYDPPWKGFAQVFDDPGSYAPGTPWADDVDATYHLLRGYFTTVPNERHSTSASADFPTRLPSGITSVDLAVRWSRVSASDTETFNLALSDAETGDFFDGLINQGFGGMGAGPFWSTATFAQDYYSDRMVRATAYIPAPEPEGTYADLFKVHEVILTVTYEGGATATHAPPLRQYPRGDGLGNSARRMWPPSRSYQRSNRRAGGYL